MPKKIQDFEDQHQEQERQQSDDGFCVALSVGHESDGYTSNALRFYPFPAP